MSDGPYNEGWAKRANRAEGSRAFLVGLDFDVNNHVFPLATFINILRHLW